MFPRMLLHRPPGEGQIPKATLLQRFQSFVEGHWIRLIEPSEQCDEKAAVPRKRSRRRVHDHDDLEKRVARAELLCHMEELPMFSSQLLRREFGHIGEGSNAETSQKIYVVCPLAPPPSSSPPSCSPPPPPSPYHPHPTLGEGDREVADTDFGQTDFGHPYLTDFDQSDFGQADFGQVGPPHPEKWSTEGLGPEGSGLEGWGAQNFALFFFFFRSPFRGPDFFWVWAASFAPPLSGPTLRGTTMTHTRSKTGLA